MTDSDRGELTTQSATALAAGIAELGIRCSLEPRGRLAVLVPMSSSIERLQGAETRRALVALAKQHGFTHVAVELPDDHGASHDADAPLLRD